MRKWLIPVLVAVVSLAIALPAMAGDKTVKKETRASKELSDVHKKRIKERLGMLSEDQLQTLKDWVKENPEKKEGLMLRLGSMMPADWNKLRARLSMKPAPARERKRTDEKRARSREGERKDKSMMRRTRDRMRDFQGRADRMPRMRQGMQGRRPFGMVPGMPGPQNRSFAGMQGRRMFQGMPGWDRDKMKAKWGKRIRRWKNDKTSRYQRARRYTYGMKDME